MLLLHLCSLLDLDAKLHAQRSQDLVEGLHGWIAFARLDVAQGMYRDLRNLAQRTLVNAEHIATGCDDFTYLPGIH